MYPHARFRLADGRLVALGHGDLIGRLGSARLCLDDPSVSEAHAMVSLRGRELLLLGLRGRFALGGKPLSRLVLRAGQEIRLSRQTTVTVEALELPNQVLALEGAGLGRQVLAGVCSLRSGGDGLRLVSKFEADAAAWLFSVDGEWRARVGSADPVPVTPGDILAVAGHEVRAVSVDLTTAEGDETSLKGAITQPLRIVARYESVHIYRTTGPVVVLTGIGARLISELAATGVPTPWEVLAREVWSDEDSDPVGLRARFDTALLRLRRKLRQAGIREDLIRTDGHGSVELVRYRDDVIDDDG